MSNRAIPLIKAGRGFYVLLWFYVCNILCISFHKFCTDPHNDSQYSAMLFQARLIAHA